jgi:hypothetical protein
MRLLLIIAQAALLLWQPLLWFNGEAITGVGLGFVVADIIALVWLLSNPRCQACFQPDHH